MPFAMQFSSATVVNLSLLTADFYSLLCGLLLFHYKVGEVVSFYVFLVYTDLLPSFLHFLPKCCDQTPYVPTFVRIILGKQQTKNCMHPLQAYASIGNQRHYGDCCRATGAAKMLGYALTK